MHRLLSTRGRLSALLIAATFTASAVGSVGSAAAASSHAAGRGVSSLSVASPNHAKAADSSAPCFGSSSGANCSSTNPLVSVFYVDTGDTSACTFDYSLNWGDGSAAQTVVLSGPPDGTYLLATHTYETPGTYSITATGTVTGPCTISTGTLTFTLLSGVSSGPPTVDAGEDQTILGTDKVSLQGQATDATVTTWSKVSGPGTVAFTSDDPQTTAKVSAPGTYVLELAAADAAGDTVTDDVTITVLSYVALGDSYSAGDGAGSYLPGTQEGSGGNGCLRSQNAYPELVDAYVASPEDIAAGQPNSAFVFGACTGAETKDIAKPQETGILAQISYLGGPKTVGLVTLSIGGNDAEFGPVMKYCALRPSVATSCEDHSSAAVADDMKVLGKRVSAVLTQIKSAPALVPGAQIIVVGYPSFFSANQDTACSSGVVKSYYKPMFEPSDMAWINAKINQADDIIAQAAAAAGVTYVQTDSAFAGNASTSHELCTAQPWLNSVVTSNPIESFHPNVFGQAEFAELTELAVLPPPVQP